MGEAVGKQLPFLEWWVLLMRINPGNVEKIQKNKKIEKNKKSKKIRKKVLTNENACANIREVAERNRIKATGKNLKRRKPKAE